MSYKNNLISMFTHFGMIQNSSQNVILFKIMTEIHFGIWWSIKWFALKRFILLFACLLGLEMKFTFMTFVEGMI